jgi:hypothetical protein
MDKIKFPKFGAASRLGILSRSLIIVMSVLISDVAEAAPVETPSGYITFMGGGWTFASSRVQTTFAFTNPAACTATDGYSVDANDAGHDLFNAMLLTAFTGHIKVSLIIDGCSQNRPHIIGVYLSAQ